MRFRPCIDIHNGRVKQIVGGSLLDEGNRATENFVSEQNADFYAKLYKKKGIRGGHMIQLNRADSVFAADNVRQAHRALEAYPGGLQIGGGINPDNALRWLDAGASHVIVSSYVFDEVRISREKLEKMRQTVGKERLVLDLSCRREGLKFRVVTKRWQYDTNEQLTVELLKELSEYCDEFLVHAADVEGKASGIEGDLVEILAGLDGFPVTYAGGVGSFADLEKVREKGKNRVDVTVGSALDIFGGNMQFEAVLEACK